MRKMAMLAAMAFLLTVALAQAGSKTAPDVKGWEKGGEYDRMFDPKESDTLKGKVVKIFEVTPLPDMVPGVALQIEDKKDKTLEFVHMGPKGFVDLAAIGLKEGDEVKVAGAWAEFDGQDIMMAVKVKKGENVQLKVRRTKDGFPFWSMSAEERQRETAGE